MSPEMLRVLIVDNHPLVRTGLAVRSQFLNVR
jgi:DNA-binding NarL/FixJ family response regulator